MKTSKMLSFAACAVLALAACGDDDDDAAEDASAATTEAPAPATTEAAPATTAAEGAAATSAPADPYCALVVQMFNQDTPPSAEQLTEYQEIAPAEIQDAVAIAAPPIIAAGDDVVAFYNAFATDEVEAAVADIDAFENETCGVEHEPSTPPPGVSREVEPDATRVDVVATDYAFDMPATLDAGRTSFVLDNQGHEAHFLLIAKLAEGATLEEAMASEDDSMLEGFWESGLAAGGGADEEALTFDLEPGNYGALCFIAAPDGTPHAMLGMQKEFTVS